MLGRLMWSEHRATGLEGPGQSFFQSVDRKHSLESSSLGESREIFLFERAGLMVAFAYRIHRNEEGRFA
jgi:hypothetical protein